MSLGIRQLRESAATIVFACLAVACGTSGSVDTTLPDDAPVEVTADFLAISGSYDLNGEAIPIIDPARLEAGDEITSNDEVPAEDEAAPDDLAHGVITLGDEYTIELFKGASLRIVGLTPPELSIYLYAGHIDINDTDETTSRLRIDTDGADMETVGEGGRFTVCQPPSNDTCMVVLEGVVELSSGGVTTSYSSEDRTDKTAIFVVKDNPPAPERCVPTQDYDQWFEQARLNQSDMTLRDLVNVSPICGTEQEKTTVEVPSTQLWTDTGIDLRVGDILEITAFGSIKPGQNTVLNGPEGNPDLDVPTNVPGLEDENHAALIGRIGLEGVPFLVGPELSAHTVETDGRLYLGINDIGVENNEGSFAAEVTVTRLPGD